VHCWLSPLEICQPWNWCHTTQ